MVPFVVAGAKMAEESYKVCQLVNKELEEQGIQKTCGWSAHYYGNYLMVGPETTPQERQKINCIIREVFDQGDFRGILVYYRTPLGDGTKGDYDLKHYWVIE